MPLSKAFIFALLCIATGPWCAICATPPDEEVFEDYYKEYTEDKSMRLFSSSYDYAPLAKEITAGCTSDYQRIKAIYYWVCDNIDYDTSYDIYKADSCIKYRKGVCQAYCELFCHLANAEGIRVEIVGGYSKNQEGFVSGSGHSWLFAYTRERHGIFLDPTWGAGTLKDHRFIRNKDYWHWFNVQPEWLILTHYPDNEVYQMINHPVTFEEFRAMQVANPLWVEYGVKVHDIYQMIRHNNVTLPKFFNRGEGDFEIIDIPMCQSLKIGRTYTFRIKKKKASREIAISNGMVTCKEREWKNEGNDVYSVDFMPRATDAVNFGMKDPTVPDYWNFLLEYAVEEPTPTDWAMVEKVHPLCVPDAKDVANLNAEVWEQAGIDGHEMLRQIRQDKIKELPILYRDKGQRLKIVSVPMNKHLSRGKSYTFQFLPECGVEWVIVNNNTWYKNWNTSNGIYTMTITPKSTGRLALFVRMETGGYYWTCLEYDVK